MRAKEVGLQAGPERLKSGFGWDGKGESPKTPTKFDVNALCEMDPDQRVAYRKFETQRLLKLKKTWIKGGLLG